MENATRLRSLARDDGSFDRISQTAINKDGCKADELKVVAIRNVSGFLVPMGIMFTIAWIIQLFKCVRPYIPFLSRGKDADGDIWGRDPGECLCQSPPLSHASRDSADVERGVLGAAFDTDGNYIRKKMEGAVLTRPLYNSLWERYIQTSDSFDESECPSAP